VWRVERTTSDRFAVAGILPRSFCPLQCPPLVLVCLGVFGK
jgi:hypothetical protein